MATEAASNVALTDVRPTGKRPFMRAALPYLLSLPALLVCIGIIIPFFTAIYYSLQRYNLAFPQMRGFIWFRTISASSAIPPFGTPSASRCSTRSSPSASSCCLGSASRCCCERRTLLNDVMSLLLIMPLMIAPAIAALMWKLMTNPNFGILSYLATLIGLEDFRWASSPVDRASHRRDRRCLGLHALHDDPAARRPARPAEAALRGGGAGRRALDLRLLPDHAADAHPLHHHGALFRMLESIQQFDIIYAMTQGGPGDTLMVFQVQSYLERFQYTNVGRSAALLMVLWVITFILSNIFIKQWLKLREQARGVG